jgi:hypothetical protein
VPARELAPPDAEKLCGSTAEIGKGPLNVKNVNVQIEPATLSSLNCVTAVPSLETENVTVPVIPGGGPECVPVYVAPGTWFAPAVVAKTPPPMAPARSTASHRRESDRLPFRPLVAAFCSICYE